MKRVLIIAEKPSAMRKIAFSLATNLQKRSIYRVPFYSFKKDFVEYVVVSCLGHLFTLAPNTKNFYYPIFDVKWVPVYFVDKKMKIAKRFIKAIKTLGQDVDEVIIATDFDLEGSLIGWNVLLFLLKRKKAKRMKFSTLTKQELINAFNNLTDLDYNQIDAGIARHTVDWIWGINVSRALILALRKAGKNFILSIGRVQGPTLRMVYEREKEIENFVPKISWKIVIVVKKNNEKLKFESVTFENKKMVEKIFEKIKSLKKIKVQKVIKKVYKLAPNPLFNTTDLQAEAYAVFKIPPEETLKIAEKLYLSGFISYPRSASQKIKNINIFPILKALKSVFLYSAYVSLIFSQERIRVTEGKKDDPAHPAIIPTNETPDISKLSKKEFLIYDLIVRRFLSALYKDAIREKIKIITKIFGIEFSAEGIKTIDEGWLKIYKPYSRIEERELPEVKQFEELEIVSVEIKKIKSKPPERYTKASLIKEMERKNLGTKGTRAEIVKILYKRGYIKGEKIKITELGKKVIEVMKKYCPEIISEELTRKLENDLNAIIEGKKRKEEVIEKTKEILKRILKKFKENEEKIGKELVSVS